jgi:hypothetical protein
VIRVFDWLVKAITGQSLLDKAMDLAIAEENANIIVKAIEKGSQMQTIHAEESSGGQFWQSRRYEELGVNVHGVHQFFNVEGVGKIIDAYVDCATSSEFSVMLFVDGDKWYSGTYSDLEQICTADSHLSVYQDANSSEYFIKFSDISFVSRAEISVVAKDLTFDVLRVNYEMLV